MNKINLKSKYKVETNFDINAISNESLYYCYLPIIGNISLTLYNFFLIDSKNNLINSIFCPITRLFTNNNFLLDNLVDSINKLELINLIEVYLDNKTQNLIFKLKKPVEGEIFFSNHLLAKMLKSKIGVTDFKLTENFFKRTISKENFEKVTQEFSLYNVNDISDSNLNINLNLDVLFNFFKKNKIEYDKFWNSDWENEIIDLVFFKNIAFSKIILIFQELYKFKKINIDDFKKIAVYFERSKIDSFDNFINLNKQKNSKFNLLKNMSFENFIELRLSRKPTNDETLFLKKVSKKGLIDQGMINLLLDFSILKNGFIVIKYLEKIINSIHLRNINTFDLLVTYLSEAFKSSLSKEGVKSIKTNSQTLEEIDQDLSELIF